MITVLQTAVTVMTVLYLVRVLSIHSQPIHLMDILTLWWTVVHFCAGHDRGGSADFVYLETVNNQIRKLTGPC